MTGASSGIGAATARVLAAAGLPGRVRGAAGRPRRGAGRGGRRRGRGVRRHERRRRRPARRGRRRPRARARQQRRRRARPRAGGRRATSSCGSRCTRPTSSARCGSPRPCCRPSSRPTARASSSTSARSRASLAYEGGGGYTVAKHGVHVMTETLRLELVDQPVRITLVAPGMVRTEEFSLTRFGGDRERADAVYAGVPDPLVAEDVADAIGWMATRPAHVNIDLLVIKPRAQAAPHKVHRGHLTWRPTRSPRCVRRPRGACARACRPRGRPSLTRQPGGRRAGCRQGWRRWTRQADGVAQVAVADAAEDEPVVQPVAPPGPELHLVGQDPVPAPEVGHRDVAVAARVGELRRAPGVLRPRARPATRSARTAARSTPRCATPRAASASRPGPPPGRPRRPGPGTGSPGTSPAR